MHEFFEARALDRSQFRTHGFLERTEASEAGFAGLEVGQHLTADEPGDETFQFRFGRVIVASVSGLLRYFDGSDGAEGAQSLTGRTFADIEALD